MRQLFADRIYRLPRIWSNRQLERFAALFSGDVVNVSAWKDEDKEGRHYRDYFVNAASYTITNWNEEARGFQGLEGEIYLDLESPLPQDLVGRFDVVYNHTTLEHIYEVDTAFGNLCLMSRDVVMLCVPFLQPYHGDYGDYWRFTPLCVSRLFKTHGMTPLYLDCSNHRNSSVYVFALASKIPERWSGTINPGGTFPDQGRVAKEHLRAGERSIPVAWNRILRKIASALGLR